MSRLIVAPEPGRWLKPVTAQLRATHVLAPWAMSRVPAWFPARVRAFARRRRLVGATNIFGWQLPEGALRMWAGTRADRKLNVRFALRHVIDRMAAAWILRLRPSVVVAPSCGARRSFAAAHRVGAECVLIEDLPDLRGLHRDLSAAARAHPLCRFLSRYRAPAALLARQEAERVLASSVWVRGRYAERERVRSGMPPGRIRELRDAVPPLRPASSSAAGAARILLAGIAAARHGTVEALAAICRFPNAQLLVRPGEGMEPADMLHHPRVIADDGGAVDLVIAPSWCESYPADVAQAAAAGIPVIATGRAAGFASVIRVPVGDAHALADAIAAAIAAPKPFRAAT